MKFRKIGPEPETTPKKALCPNCNRHTSFVIFAQTRSQHNDDYLRCPFCGATFEVHAFTEIERQNLENLYKQLDLVIIHHEFEIMEESENHEET